MNTNTIPSKTLLATALVLALTAGLAACGKKDDATAGQKLDATINKVEQKTDQAAERTGEAMKDAGQAASQAATSVGQAASNAATSIGEAASNVATGAASSVADAMITTAVKAELARDPGLSALRIDVDTAYGRVALSGSAPDETAKTRATTLATAVKGVTGVDNRLVVGAK